MTGDRSPQVSVVMPALNAGRWLAEAVESLLAQTLQAFELLIVDDGSNDCSAELLSVFAARDSRIRVIRQPRQSLVSALNRGLDAARAPLLARLDADDIAHPTRLERQVRYLNRANDVGLVGSWVREIDDRGRPIGRRTPETRPEELNRLLMRANPFVHSAIMARTELLRRLGGYRDAFQGAEDYDLWLRAAEVARLANLPEQLVSYRVHEAGVSRRDALRQAFSVRLARRAAMARREQGRDPANGLAAPPDWRSSLSDDTFYARDAALYRWLERADSSRFPDAAARRSQPETLVEHLPELSHAERRLAALALLALMRSADRTEARTASQLLLRLCRERPRTVLKAAWSLRRRRPARLGAAAFHGAATPREDDPRDGRPELVPVAIGGRRS